MHIVCVVLPLRLNEWIHPWMRTIIRRVTWSPGIKKRLFPSGVLRLLHTNYLEMCDGPMLVFYNRAYQ